MEGVSAGVTDELIETLQQGHHHHDDEEEEDEDTFNSPFFLELKIIAAESLPVADITTSDPYVTVYVGGRFAGRTETIFRNHRNPQWNETFSTSLLHRGSNILLKIWDEDRGKDDDLMGTCRIQLLDFPLESEIKKWYNIESINNYNTSTSRIEVAVRIKSNEKLIRIIKETSLNMEDNVEEEVIDAITTIVKEFPYLKPSECVENTLKRSIKKDTISFFNLSEIKDLLCDVHTIIKEEIKRNKSEEDDHKMMINNNVFNRTSLRLINATRVIFQGRLQCYQHPPIEENYIQLNLSSNESLYVLMKFPNRLSCWNGARWLQLLYDIWHRIIKPSDVPYWASSGFFTLSSSLIQLSDGRLFHGNIKMYFDKKFRLFINKEMIEIDSMCDMILSLDSIIPSSYIMDVEVLAFSMDGEFSEADKLILETEKASDTEKESEKKSGVIFAIGDNIKGTFTGAFKGMTYAAVGTVKGAKHIATGTAHVAAGTAQAVAIGTVGAARTLATANPVKIIEASSETVMGGVKGVTGAVVGASNYLTRESTTYLMMKHGYFSQQVHSRNYDHFYVDWGSDDFMSHSGSKTLMREKRNSKAIDNVGSEYHLYPPHDNSKSGVMVLCCHGAESMENIVGHRRLSAQMLSQRVGSVFEQPLNSDLGFSVTLKSASGLQLHPPSLDNQFYLPSIRDGGIYAKIKFVDMHGKASGIIRQVDSVKTPCVAQSSTIDFRDFTAIFRAKDGMEHAEYVRIELVMEDVRYLMVLGTAFIPLTYFQLTPAEYSFPLTRFKQNAVHPRSAIVSQPLGEITVSIKRLEEMSDTDAMIAIRPSLYECNIFNTRWYVECALAGSVDSESCMVEAGVIMATHDYLELIPEGDEGNFGTKRYELAAVSSSIEGMAAKETVHNPKEQQVDELHIKMHSPHQVGNNVNYKYRKENSRMKSPSKGERGSFSTKEQSSQNSIDQVREETREITINVFENQRRQPYFPFDWSTTAYTRPQYSDFSFNTAYRLEFVERALPPPGYYWKEEEWVLDKKYLETDSHGWVYGFRFGSILSNSKAGKSVTKPIGMHARRRKWVRTAVCLQPGEEGYEECMIDASEEQVMQLFAQQQTKHGISREKSLMRKSSGSRASMPPSWRKKVVDRYSGTVIRVCEERKSPTSAALFPWSRVRSTSIVTTSVLSISVEVNRYFGEVNGTITYRPADMEFFVSNCPAAALKGLIEERIWFARIKKEIKSLVESGNLTGNKDFVPPVFTHSSQEDGDEDVPETAELSTGSEIVADLDDNSIIIEKKLKELKDLQEKITTNDIEQEMSVLVRRDCRLKLYMAALLGVGLKGNHDFSDEAVKAIIHRDYKRARNIVMDTEIATANNRIEFFMDIAEKRIRDAVLTGWNYRSTVVNQRGQLNRCLALFANGYFIQIVSLLAAFFEENARTDMKGLGSKIELITTYLKHNDRLAIILDNALRPYYMRSEPPAKLSLFLDFDILLSWYTTVLVVEMRSRVDDTLRVWMDPNSDVAGMAELYNFELPWIPQRASNCEGLFFSNIPEDLVELLMTYVQYARLDRQALASSLQKYVGKLDGEVCLSYTAAFLYLAEQYERAITKKDWAGSNDEEELMEGSTWLSSVANDALRVIRKHYHVALRRKELQTGSRLQLEDLTEESQLEKAAVQKAQSTYANVARHAMDHLSCIIFSFVFHDRENLLSDEFLLIWRDALNGNLPLSDGSIDSKTLQRTEIITNLTNDMNYFLERNQEFLEPRCFQILQSITADKIITFFLSFIESANRIEFEFTMEELNQLQKDISVVAGVFHNKQLVYDLFSDDETNKTIDQQFELLDIALEILTLDLNSTELNHAMNRLIDLARAVPHDANALGELAEVCFELRGVHLSEERLEKAIKKMKENHSIKVQKVQPHQQENDGKKKRGSMLSLFGYDGQPAAAATAAAAAAGREDKIKSEDEEDSSEMDADILMQEELMRMKQQAMASCLGIIVDEIRAYHPAAEKQGGKVRLRKQMIKHLPVEHISPVRRVFGQLEAFGDEYAYSLEQLILASSVSYDQAMTRSCTSNPASPSTIKQPRRSIANRIKGLFLGSNNSKDIHSGSQFMKKISSSNIDHATDDAFISEDGISCLEIKDLMVSDLFHLEHTFYNPHPYLIFRLGKVIIRNRIIDTDTTSADWSHEKPIVLPLSGASMFEQGSRLANLHITLCYEGLINDHVVASVTIPFAPYSLPHFTKKTFIFDDFSHSSKAKTAAEKAKAEGRALPCAVMSISPIAAGSMNNEKDNESS